ncbi:NnrU protein [Halieaceae bacterium IMCC14734]|uniref:NnrU protein n=1 Tax=Candidatus Litorirhabdus singularis TaxID=2518993 RepID=A0ABT3TH66_9GAMM|nr:NnrU family protein [Candidatus Litorirhabdus singularis]MCX2981652.1 NnrU protein [Candidatus Litorirhabdus singularis]
MSLLIGGICLWAAVHFIPTLFPSLKTSVKAKLGEGGYMGLFSLGVLSGLGLIVMGWRSAQPSLVYLPPVGLQMLALPLMLVAFLLFISAKRNTRLKRILPHPQLSSLVLWSVAHLLANGDSRSLALFGGLGLWALLEIVLISRRDGPAAKVEPPSWGSEILGLVIAVVVTAVVYVLHPWIAGVPVV